MRGVAAALLLLLGTACGVKAPPRPPEPAPAHPSAPARAEPERKP